MTHGSLDEHNQPLPRIQPVRRLCRVQWIDQLFSFLLARSFYILSCFCSATQSTLNELVSTAEQQKHSEAEMKKEETRVPEFRCPKCSRLCNDYRFDWGSVTLFRQNFSGARLTYILVDVTSSMTFNILQTIAVDKKSVLPRIQQTKEAIKQLLKEIAADATPLDQAILATFDDKLRKPALIPQSRALDIAEEAHLAHIDAIELSPRSVKTHFYSVVKEVYEMFERQPFRYIDLYIFSDGVDTSPKKNDKAYQAIIRGLSEKIGAKCHFINCGSAVEGFSVSAWLGDKDADCDISGGVEDIKTQVKAVYRRDHVRNIELTPASTLRVRGKTVDISIPTSTTYMTDKEAASIRKPKQKPVSKDDHFTINPASLRPHRHLTHIDDLVPALPSAVRSRSATATDARSKSPDLFRIITRNLSARKLGKDWGE